MRILLLTVLILAAIAIGALFYPGQLPIFLLFSLVFFAILFSAFFLPFQYAHLFLAIPFFLGFWLKLVAHFAFDRFGLKAAAAYFEPTGSFDGSAAAWDQVLMIAAIGGLGYLAGRLLLAPLIAASNERAAAIKAPPWYRALRTPLWLLAALAFVAIVVVNAETGLMVRGYVPRIQLPWPFGALFSWTTDIGFALVLCVLAGWDRALGAGATRGFFALCIEGAVVSIQTNSRGIYLFHTLPALVSEARRPLVARLPNGKAALFLGLWVVGAIAIPLISTGLRAFGEQAVLAKTAQEAGPVAASTPRDAVSPPSPTSPSPSNQQSAPATPISRPDAEQLKSFMVYAFQGGSRLIVDRWPGLEGLMAVQSYSGRSLALLKEAALERRTYGMVDIYTKNIALSSFTEEQTKRFHSATLAGPIAFFFYSGSWLIVLCGMALLAILTSVLEIIWARLVPDPLVTAVSGCYLALVVMQLSTGVAQAASGLITVTAALALVWGIGRASELIAIARSPVKQAREVA